MYLVQLLRRVSLLCFSMCCTRCQPALHHISPFFHNSVSKNILTSIIHWYLYHPSLVGCSFPWSTTHWEGKQLLLELRWSSAGSATTPALSPSLHIPLHIIQYASDDPVAVTKDLLSIGGLHGKTQGSWYHLARGTSKPLGYPAPHRSAFIIIHQHGYSSIPVVRLIQ